MFSFRSPIQINDDKPLNLKVQRILKEMKQKSQIIGNMFYTTSGLFVLSSLEEPMKHQTGKKNAIESDMMEFSIENQWSLPILDVDSLFIFIMKFYISLKHLITKSNCCL